HEDASAPDVTKNVPAMATAPIASVASNFRMLPPFSVVSDEGNLRDEPQPAVGLLFGERQGPLRMERTPDGRLMRSEESEGGSYEGCRDLRIVLRQHEGGRRNDRGSAQRLG